MFTGCLHCKHLPDASYGCKSDFCVYQCCTNNSFLLIFNLLFSQFIFVHILPTLFSLGIDVKFPSVATDRQGGESMAKKTKTRVGPRSGAYGRSGEIHILGCFILSCCGLWLAQFGAIRDATGVGYNIPRDCRLYVESDNCPCCIYIIFYEGLQNVIGRV